MPLFLILILDKLNEVWDNKAYLREKHQRNPKMTNYEAKVNSLTIGQELWVTNPDTDRQEIAIVTGTGERKGNPTVEVKFSNGDEKYIYAFQTW